MENYKLKNGKIKNNKNEKLRKTSKRRITTFVSPVLVKNIENQKLQCFPRQNNNHVLEYVLGFTF